MKHEQLNFWPVGVCGGFMFTQCDPSGACPALLIQAGICAAISGGLIPLFVVMASSLRDALLSRRQPVQNSFEAIERKHAA